MRIGRHYKMREIQPRHFKNLAKACSYPADALTAMLEEMAEQLPDEALAVANEVGGNDVTREVMGKLVDKLNAQYRTTRRLIDGTG